MLEVHEAAEIFPEMDAECFGRLRTSILDNGQLDPIVLFQGKIIDGRHRHKACIQTGIATATRNIEDDASYKPDKFDAIEYVVATNAARRHLTSSQLAMVGQKAKSFYADEAKERMAAGGGDKKSGVETLPHPIEGIGRARDKAAAAVGVSGRLVDAADKVVKQGTPELAAAVKSGKVSVTKAAKIAKAPKEDQAAIVAGEKPIPEGPCPHGGEHDFDGVACKKCHEPETPVAKLFVKALEHMRQSLLLVDQIHNATGRKHGKFHEPILTSLDIAWQESQKWRGVCK